MVSLSALRVIAAGAENWLALRLCPTGSNRGTGSQRDVPWMPHIRSAYSVTYSGRDEFLKAPIVESVYDTGLPQPG